MFFWAPVMKWCLVAAGLKDLGRPAEKLSVSQNVGAYLPRFVGSFAPEKAIFVFQLWPQLASSGCATRSLSHRSTIPSQPYALSPVLSYGQLNRTDPMQVNFFVGCTGLYQLGRVYQFVPPRSYHSASACSRNHLILALHVMPFQIQAADSGSYRDRITQSHGLRRMILSVSARWSLLMTGQSCTLLISRGHGICTPAHTSQFLSPLTTRQFVSLSLVHEA